MRARRSAPTGPWNQVARSAPLVVASRTTPERAPTGGSAARAGTLPAGPRSSRETTAGPAVRPASQSVTAAGSAASAERAAVAFPPTSHRGVPSARTGTPAARRSSVTAFRIEDRPLPGGPTTRRPPVRSRSTRSGSPSSPPGPSVTRSTSRAAWSRVPATVGSGSRSAIRSGGRHPARADRRKGEAGSTGGGSTSWQSAESSPRRTRPGGRGAVPTGSGTPATA